ncbi:MAG TPA: nucleotidyltransferase domain-containing protein [Candidatus Nanoarchaeia archaeon]|nr:nucleotidyltransferase domain-containing protein [Candidatus Nanoarchaeia archaeon]
MKKPIVQKKNQVEEKQSISLLKVLDFLALHPNDSFSLTELAKRAKVSKAMASQVVRALVKDKLVIQKTIANIWRIQFNNDDLAARGYKISMNLRIIYSKRIVEAIVQEFGNPRSIILFGSVRKGEDQPGSDIDIAVEVEGTQEVTIMEGEVLYQKFPKLKAFEERFGRRLRLHFYSQEAIDKNIFLNIINGILLYGLLEVRK